MTFFATCGIGVGRLTKPEVVTTEVGWETHGRGPLVVDDATRANYLVQTADTLVRSDCHIAALIAYTWTTREQIPPEAKNSIAAARLADEIKDVPCVVLAFGVGKGQASSVIPAVQNLMLAARALGMNGNRRKK